MVEFWDGNKYIQTARDRKFVFADLSAIMFTLSGVNQTRLSCVYKISMCSCSGFCAFKFRLRSTDFRVLPSISFDVQRFVRSCSELRALRFFRAMMSRH